MANRSRSVADLIRDPRPIAGGSEGDPDPKPEDDPKKDEEPFDEERAKAKIAKANSEAANLRKRLKEAEKAEAELKKIQDAQKSDAERSADEKKSLEDKAAKAEAEVLKLRVALRKGLSDTQAKRLVGTTEDELEADADELLESFKPSDDKDTGKPGGGKPKEALRGGGDPTEEPEEMDPRKLAAAVPRV